MSENAGSDGHIRATCDYVPNNSVTGRVISSEKIELPNFTCGRGVGTPRDRYGFRNSHLTMYVQFKDPADSSKMHPGEHVTLGGVFQIITQNNGDYLLVRDAKVLHGDPFEQSE